MTTFSSELSGSLILNSGSVTAELQPYSGGLNVSGSDLYINGIALDTRIRDLEAGNAGTASLRPLNDFSGSILTYTASNNLRVGALESSSAALNTKTGSLQSQVDSLISVTGSYLTTSSTYFSSSAQISSSGFLTSESAAAEGFGSGGDTTPDGTISSSAQIEEFGFVTGSPDGTISSSTQVIASLPAGTISGSDQITGSLPSGTVSGSAQIEELGFITSSGIDTSILATTGSNVFSGSQTVSGSVTATQFRSTGGGTPTLIAGSTLKLSASNAIQIQGGVLRLPSFANSDTGSLTLQTGDFIFNTSSNDVQVYSSSAFINLLTSQSAASLGFGGAPDGTVSSSAQVTGSTLITASVSSNTITFTKGDQSTFDITVDTGSGGGGGDIGTLNSFSASVATFTGSIQTQVDTLESKTGSYATTASNHFTQSQFFTGSLIPHADGTNNGIYDLGTQQNPWRDLFLTTASLKFVKDGEIVSTVSGEREAIRVGNVLITTASLSIINNDGSIANTVFSSSIDGNGSASLAQQAEVTFDGNKQVSNTDLGDLFSASFNPGTTGSISEFLNAVFFPNSAPTITTGNQTISEFTTSGSTITTVAGTDPEGQSLTFGTSSAYTDDFVRVASNGTMTLNVLATGSMNTTDRGDGTLAHPIILRAVDTFDAAVTKTIYLDITLNEAPVFRQDSVSGNVITAFSASRNESATSGEVTKIYFTDPESDTITITSASDANSHFIFQRTGSYVRLLQNTASLDYETTSSYTLSLTASDEHNVSGDDGNSFTTLPVTITVVDNATPTINPQTITGVTESAAASTNAGTVSATDTEGNTLTFGSFTLAGLKIDGSDVSLSTYGGTGKNDPTENAFQMNSSGQVTVKSGAYLNSDLINSYIYSASVADAFNNAVSASVTIPIVDDQAATISGTTTLYIIESAVSGDGVKTNTNGFSGTNARFTADQAVTWSISSSNDYNINSSGYVTIARNISGSSDIGGGQITGRVTASNAFGTTSSLAFTVNITDNVAPNITFTDTDSNLNTNGARSGSTITTISFNDSEGDDVDLNSFSFTDPSGQLNTVQAGGTFLVQPNNNLSGSSYGFTASIADTGSFETRTSFHDVTIASAPIGSGSTNGAFYIIESAVSGANVVLNTNGRTGTQGDVNVTYDPQYNSAAVQSFTSSNSAIAIDSSGGLTLNLNLSGSSTSSGDTISSTITYQDQYNNVGSSSISVSVALNSLPTASFTNQTSKFNTNLGTSGTTLVSASITDVESDTPYSASLSGLSGSAFTIQFNNANSSSFEIKAASDLAAGDYPYTASVFDNFDKSNEYNRSITIAQAQIGTLISSSNFFIIESATNGASARLNADGRTGTAADVNVNYSPDYGSQAVQSFTSSNSQLALNTSGNITLGFNLSGSGTASGDTITSDITYRDQYDNIGSGSITVTVATNNAPDIIFSDTSGNQNTNLGRSGSTLVTLTFSDTESDTINYAGVTFEGTGSQLNPVRSGNSWLIQAKNNLSASTYSFTASVQDEHQFNTNTESDSFTISAADIGTLSANGTLYIIESAESGSFVVTNSNGRTGTTGSLSVSYSPSYGSPAVASFTSSNSQVNVDSSGIVTVAEHISGSGTGSGDTITSTITFRDQYDNVGSGSITINVTENAAPTVISFTDITSNQTASVAVGTDLVSMSISDTESNTPFSASLSGTNASDLTFQYLNADSSSAFIEAASTLAAGTYNYNVTVHDSFGKSTTYSGRSFTIASQPYLVYAYGYDGGSPSSEAAAFGTLGDTGGDGVGVQSGSVIAMFESGALGTTFSPSFVGGDCELLSSASLERLNNDNTADTGSGLASLGALDFSGDSQIALFLFPSASVVAAKPSGMYTAGLPDSSPSAGEYALYASDIAIPGVVGAAVYYFDLESAHLGHTNWGMIFQTGQNNNNSKYYLVPSSGSAP